MWPYRTLVWDAPLLTLHAAGLSLSPQGVGAYSLVTHISMSSQLQDCTWALECACLLAGHLSSVMCPLAGQAPELRDVPICWLGTWALWCACLLAGHPSSVMCPLAGRAPPYHFFLVSNHVLLTPPVAGGSCPFLLLLDTQHLPQKITPTPEDHTHHRRPHINCVEWWLHKDYTFGCNFAEFVIYSNKVCVFLISVRNDF